MNMVIDHSRLAGELKTASRFQWEAHYATGAPNPSVELCSYKSGQDLPRGIQATSVWHANHALGHAQSSSLQRFTALLMLCQLLPTLPK